MKPWVVQGDYFTRCRGGSIQESSAAGGGRKYLREQKRAVNWDAMGSSAWCSASSRLQEEQLPAQGSAHSLLV